jgi:chromosome partitioning protein
MMALVGLMSVISIANPKGGVGKTTTTHLLATHLAHHAKASVVIIDADRNKPHIKWRKGNSKSTVHIIEQESENLLARTIDAAAQENQFVFVDLEGSASLAVTRAIAVSDFVVIPIKTSALDSDQAIKAINFVEEEMFTRQKMGAARKLPYAILLTETSAPGAPVPRSRKRLEQELNFANIPIFKTTLDRREAFRLVFEEQLALFEIQSITAASIQAAERNIASLAYELLRFVTGKEGAER